MFFFTSNGDASQVVIHLSRAQISNSELSRSPKLLPYHGGFMVPLLHIQSTDTQQNIRALRFLLTTSKSQWKELFEQYQNP